MHLIISEQRSLTRSKWIRVVDDTGEIYEEFDNPDDLNEYLAKHEMGLVDPLCGLPGYVRVVWLVVDEHALDDQPFSIERE